LKRVAVYPGTFDPITNGHLDILGKAADLFDEIILGVAKVTGKNTLFSVEERAELCRQATAELPKVRVQQFDGLVVEFAKEIKAVAMIRGLRAISDFEYELSQALMNKKLSDKVDTVFFVPDYKYLYLSSTMIRQVVSLGADVKDLIPVCVEKALIEKFSGKEIT
jgi:pantetheine-phosphate adenylyltransferase